MSIPPPEGMNEADYVAIEAAVTETVRGRWFLNEFARRTRAGEMRELLAAMARLETRIESAPALPSADPSVRMLIQRIKEIAGHLDGLSQDMREEGVEARFVSAVEDQARAVSGMMRGAPPARPAEALSKPVASPPVAEAKVAEAKVETPPPPMVRMPRANLPLAFASPLSTARATPAEPEDPRLAALLGLDGLPLAKKLAAFS